eukprot:4793133-Heterocapsa_arctica.AAC.1
MQCSRCPQARAGNGRAGSPRFIAQVSLHSHPPGKLVFSGTQGVNLRRAKMSLCIALLAEK